MLHTLAYFKQAPVICYKDTYWAANTQINTPSFQIINTLLNTQQTGSKDPVFQGGS